MPVGVVIERRALNNPWQKWRWSTVAIIPGAAPVEEWREIERSGEAVRWHAATLPLELHRKETDAYRDNLNASAPGIYVVLRTIPGGAADRAVQPFKVTASTYEAQDHLDIGEDIVTRVALTQGLRAWIEAFIARHHTPEPFKKRRRERYDPEEAAFGRRPDHPDLSPKRRVH